MARSRTRDIAAILGRTESINIDNTAITAEGGAEGGAGGGSLTTYTSLSELPLSHNDGDMAFVKSNNRLYISNGLGWYNIALVNSTPTFTTLPLSLYALDSNGGTPSALSLTANDSDGTPLFWTYSTTDSAYDLSTITNDSSGGYTITTKSLADILTAGYDSSGGSFDITFKVSDGISFATTTSTFIATYLPEIAASPFAEEFPTIENWTNDPLDYISYTNFRNTPTLNSDVNNSIFTNQFWHRVAMQAPSSGSKRILIEMRINPISLQGTGAADQYYYSSDLQIAGMVHRTIAGVTEYYFTENRDHGFLSAGWAETDTPPAASAGTAISTTAVPAAGEWGLKVDGGPTASITTGRLVPPAPVSTGATVLSYLYPEASSTNWDARIWAYSPVLSIQAGDVIEFLIGEDAISAQWIKMSFYDV